jgi:hypothetical protein
MELIDKMLMEMVNLNSQNQVDMRRRRLKKVRRSI